MKQSLRSTALTLAASVGLSLFGAGAAEAGSKGRQNTAIALGAVAAYGVVKKKPVVAGVAGAGAVYSYVRSRQSAGKEREASRRRERLRRARRVSRTRYVAVPASHVHSRSCGHSGHTPPGWSKGKKTGWDKHGKHKG